MRTTHTSVFIRNIHIAIVLFTLYIHFLYAIDQASLLPYTSLRADSYVLYAIEHSNLS